MSTTPSESGRCSRRHWRRCVADGRLEISHGLFGAARHDLRLLTEGDRDAALGAAVVAGPLAQVVFARERRVIAGPVPPCLLKLDGLLALQLRLLGMAEKSSCEF